MAGISLYATTSERRKLLIYFNYFAEGGGGGGGANIRMGGTVYAIKRREPGPSS